MNFNFDTSAAKAQRSILFVSFEQLNAHMVITWLVPSSSITRDPLLMLTAGCVMCCTNVMFLDDGTIDKLFWAGVRSRD